MFLKAFDNEESAPIAVGDSLHLLESSILDYLRDRGDELEDGSTIKSCSRLCFVPKGKDNFLVYLIDNARIFDTGIFVLMEG